MDKLFFPFFSSNSKSICVDAEKTCTFLRQYIKDRKRSKNVLLDCAVSPHPRGLNKLWEIELSFFQVKLRLGRLMVGTPVSGFFACHQQRDFTTYSINIGGREFWFDQYDLALAALSKGVAPPESAKQECNF